MEIKKRFSGDVLWSGECDNIKAELVAAKNADANLYGANLYGADLSGADLSGADLSGADLSGANLYCADLSGANLYCANLYGANLYGANLYGANLYCANLSGANLYCADLYCANLYGANLYGAKGINPYICTPLLMLLEQPGLIRAYKLVNSSSEGPYNGGIVYDVGNQYEVDNACTDVNAQCGAGINLATLDWCMKEYQPGYEILVAEFKAKDIAAIPTGTDGKFRVHRCKIVGKKDLKEIGLA